MEWFKKFKIGQEVRVVKKIAKWGYEGMGASWNDWGMNKTIGKVYKIIEIEKSTGYRLHTKLPVGYADDLWDFWYPMESLEAVNVKGRQLLFEFMSE